MLHHAVAISPPGSVLVANVERYQYAGAWGEVLSVAAQARDIAGLVIDGAVRISRRSLNAAFLSSVLV